MRAATLLSRTALVLCLLLVGASAALSSTARSTTTVRSRVHRKVEALATRLALGERKAETLWTLGHELCIVGKVKAGTALMEDALLLRAEIGNVGNLMIVANYLRVLKCTRRAEARYLQAVRLAPGFATAYTFLGLIARERGDHMQAASLFQLCARLDRVDTKPFVASAGLMTAHGLDDATKRFRRLQHAPSISAADMSAANFGLIDPTTRHAYSLHSKLTHKHRDAAALVEAVQHARLSLQPEQTDMDGATAALHHWLRTLQFGDCTRLLVFSFAQGFGFGAHAHMLSLALSAALAFNRTLVLVSPDKWWLTDERDCRQRNWHCYFEPITSCEFRADNLREIPSLRVSRAVELSSSHAVVQLGYDAQNELMHNRFMTRFVAPPFARLGLVWWRAMLAKFLLRPIQTVYGLIDAARQRLSANSKRWPPLIGIHVRHGDKVVEASVLDVAAYIDVATALVRESRGRKSVFISSDDPDVLHIAASLGVQRQIEVLSDADELRDLDITNANVLNHRRVNVTRYALEAISNTWLLSEAQLFVGTFSSNLGRLAFELMLANQSNSTMKFGFSLDLVWYAYP